MGAGQSTSQADSPSRALHVLRVTPSSPASETNIEPFFDFVVGFEGDSLSSQHNILDVTELEHIVERHEGRTLSLLVWNSKNQETRVVPIIPSRVWSLPRSDNPNTRQQASNIQPSLLGLSMRMCEPEFAMDNVWHVLDVLEGSPAESAGLVPFGDYILGWSGGVLSAENDFYDLVEAHVDKPLRVYVYSHDFDALREVVLVPNRHWGGEGLLGCVFGFGLLHRIPPQPADRLPGSTPPELREPNDDHERQELFVPADVHSEIQHSPAQPSEWRQPSHDQRDRATRPVYEQTDSQPGSYVQAQTIHHEAPGHQSQRHLDESTTPYSTSQRTPRRSPSLPASSTTRTSAGALMNGSMTAHSVSPCVEDTSPPPGRIYGRPWPSSTQDTETAHSDSSGSEGGADDYDERISTAGTETTSRSSLTSVD